MAITLDGTAGTTTPALTNSALTSGRVTYAGTSGLLQDSANLTTDGTNLSVNGNLTAGSGNTTADVIIKSSVGNGGAGFSEVLFANSASNTRGYVSYSHASDSMLFGAVSATRLTLNSNGALVLNGGSTSADGVGVTFPATQVASTNANCLDDYEEGTFTPTLGGTATYSAQQGFYTKIGRQVTVTVTLAVSAIGTGSTTTISGLPFPTNATAISGNSVTKFGNLAVNVLGLNVIALDGSVSTLRFTNITAAGASNTFDPAIFGNSSSVYFTVIYFVN